MVGAVQYAGFFRRLAAVLIDGLLLFILFSPLTRLLSGGSYFPVSDTRNHGLAEFDWSFLLLNDILPMLIIIFFWVRYRATPGKQLMECEVVDATTHDNLRIGQSFLRYIGYFISLLPLGLGFLWIIWDPKKRGFHDLLAHTVVLHADLSRVDHLAEQPLEKLMKEAE